MLPMTLEEIIKKMHETCPEDNEDSTWEECFKYCLMGAELGSGECMANTAFCYEYGNGVEEDQDKAVEWAQKGADAGNEVAMCHLARYYDSGNGVDADAKLAFKYFKMSAEKGYSQAIGTLGCFYAEGDVVEQDYKKAFECWKKAANNKLPLKSIKLIRFCHLPFLFLYPHLLHLPDRHIVVSVRIQLRHPYLFSY